MKTRATMQNRRQKTKFARVLAQGTFDVLHLGHIRYLEFAKRHGKKLTVIVARDSTVKRVKHHAPVFPEQVRVQLVRALKCVDDAVLGEKGDILNKVLELRPNVVVLGYDQKVDVDDLREKLFSRGLKCIVIRAPPHAAHVHKSSKWKSRILAEKN